MADEVLRLRTVVVADQALAEMRGLAREIGLLPQQARRGVQQTNRELETLGATIKRVGGELKKAIPGLSGFSLSAAGIALATRQLTSGFEDVAKSIVVLGHASRELGLTTQQIRGFMTVAEKAGIAPQAMMQGMAAFRKNTEDFKLRIGSLREEMSDVGFGPLVERIKQSSTQMEAFKQAWDMAEVMGRNSIASKRLFEMLGIGSEKLRFTFEEFKADQERHPIISAKEEAEAKRYHDLMINIGTSLQNIKQREVLKFFSKFEEDKATIDWLINKFKELEGLTDKVRQKAQRPPGQGGGMQLPPSMFKGRGRSVPKFQHGGVFGGAQRSSSNDDLLRGSHNTLVKATKEGTFEALLQFARYQQAGAGAGGGGGGGGGDSLSGGAPSGGRVPSGQTPSDDAVAGQVPGQGSGGPLGLPRTPGAPGVAPGKGTAGPLGLPAVPGAPATVPGAPATAPGGGQEASSGGGADFLRQQRQPLVDQLNKDPLLKQQLADLAYRENPKAMTEVVESLYNRTIMLNEIRARQGKAPLSLRHMMTGGFYGPVNRHGLGTRNASPAALAAVDRAATSNRLEGATDQGSGRDPNVNWPGGKKVIGGETFNDWGAVGHDKSRAFRENQQRLVRESEEKAKTKSPQTADAPGPGGTAKEPEGEVEFGMPEIGTPTPAQPPIQGGAGTPDLGGGPGADLIKGRKPTSEDMGGPPEKGAPGKPSVDMGGPPEAPAPLLPPGRGPGGLLTPEDERRSKWWGGLTELERKKLITEHSQKQNYEQSPEGQGRSSEENVTGRGWRRFEGASMPIVRIDRANDAQARPRASTGTVGVQVQHNGTKAKTTAKTDGELFDKTRVKNEPAAGIDV